MEHAAAYDRDGWASLAGSTSSVLVGARIGIFRRLDVSHTKWNLDTRHRCALKLRELVVEVDVWLQGFQDRLLCNAAEEECIVYIFEGATVEVRGATGTVECVGVQYPLGDAPVPAP